ncbi:MAG: NAD-dependent epimerase/dehydratase family protein [Dermatophilaceae bacterium]
MRVPQAPLALVVGSGGLVGRGVVTALREAGVEVTEARVPWAEEAAAVDALANAFGEFARRRAGRTWMVAWCAGAGVVATGEAVLAVELRVFEQALAALRGTAGDGDQGTVFLASSAGGLHAGSADPPFDERTEPRPLVAYGRTKLAMERALTGLVSSTGLRAVIGRFSNVYGPGQVLGKPQGLISQLCLADTTGRPLPVYVSLDTIRDYLYVTDAGRMTAAAIIRSLAEPPGTVVTKVFASGRPVTVGHVIGEARRVLHRPLRVIPVAPLGAGQVLDLRFRSVVWPQVDALATTTLAAGLSATATDVQARVVGGGPLDG